MLSSLTAKHSRLLDKISSNVNTDGYKRREADLKEVGASSGSVTSTGNTAGLGVRVEDIRRSFDSFIRSHKKFNSQLRD